MTTTNKTALKFVNVICSKWFDKVNGNTYFSCKVSVKGENINDSFIIPFTYGYGEFYLQSTMEALISKGYIPNTPRNNGISQTLSNFCRENNIELMYHAYNCLKRDMIK